MAADCQGCVSGQGAETHLVPYAEAERERLSNRALALIQRWRDCRSADFRLRRSGHGAVRATHGSLKSALRQAPSAVAPPAARIMVRIRYLLCRQDSPGLATNF